ncbi:MAG: FMN-binding protein [Planctomycetes bacterium]|nr:FMN-binding protein [Planctomycetota bacterium]
MKQAVRFVIILGIICLVMGSGVALIYAKFKDTIAARDEEQRAALRLQVLPGGEGFSKPEPLPGASDVYVVKADDGRPAAYAAEGAAQGYSSTVQVMVGVAADEQLTVRKVVVLYQQETPGLGANISEAKSTYNLWQKIGVQSSAEAEKTYNEFMDQFDAKSVGQLDQVDAMTAATITSNAVKTAVRRAVERVRQATVPSGDR